MENTTIFDLSDAIRTWRENLAGSAAFRSGDLEELESHLRDSVAGLQGLGLSSEEAFWVASRRLGTGKAISAEFAKLNSRQVWLNRALWMVAGWVAIGVVSHFVSGLANYATLAAYTLTQNPNLLGAISLVSYPALLAGLSFLVWRTARRSGGKLRQAGGWMRSHPVALALIVVLVTLVNHASSIGANVLTAKTMPTATYASLMLWRYPTSLVMTLLPPILLAWLLGRTKREAILE